MQVRCSAEWERRGRIGYNRNPVFFRELLMSDNTNETPVRHRLLNPAGYIQALVRNWWLVILGAFVAAIAGAGAATVLPERFESSVTLLVSPPPFKKAEEMSMLMPQPLGVPDYNILLTSDGILMRAAAKVRALGTWDAEDLERLERISVLRKTFDLTTSVSQKTVSVTLYSPVIVLKAKASTAEQARDLVMAWAQVCEEVSREAYEKNKSGLLDFVEERFTNTQTELAGVAGQIRDMEIEWNDELSKAQLAKLHNRFLDYQEKIIDRKVQIETTRQEIRELEQRLANEPETIILHRSPPGEVLYSPGAENAKGYEEQVLNVIHVDTKQKLVGKQAELASMEEYVRQMESQMAEVEEKLQAQREELASKSFDRKMLNLAETPQMRSYDLLSGMLEQAKFVESDEVLLGDLRIISEAVVPDRKTWPPRTLFVLLAGFCGFCASVGLIVLRHALRTEDLSGLLKDAPAR